MMMGAMALAAVQHRQHEKTLRPVRRRRLPIRLNDTHSHTDHIIPAVLAPTFATDPTTEQLLM